MKITPQTFNPNIPQDYDGAMLASPLLSLNHSKNAAEEAAPASGPQSVAPAQLPPCMSLSPESLLAYCESRLSSLDSQMETIANTQQQNATVTQDLNGVATALAALPDTPNNPSPPTVDVSNGTYVQVVNAYNTAIKDAGPNTQLGQLLATDLQTFQTAAGSSPPSGNNTVQMSSDSLTSLQTDVKNDTATLNSNSETSMITLQSLMSQRQTAIQLTTNLVQSLGDQANDIAKNVGQ